jgi:hypothetical protein
MKTFKIESTKTNIINYTYYIDAEDKSKAESSWNTEEADESDESEGIEELVSIVETDEHGNDL